MCLICIHNVTYIMEKKNTLSVSNLPQFDANPFIEKAIISIEEKTVKRKQYFGGSKGVENIVSNVASGEVIGHTNFVRYVELDEEKFAKIYLSQFTAFWDLTKTAIRVFGYVINNLIPNKDVVYIDIQEVMQVTKYKEEKSVYKGLAELVNAGMIARSKNHMKYFINPMIFFNGDRVTYATTYIKKKKAAQKTPDPSQLSMFNSGLDPNSIADFFRTQANRTEALVMASISLMIGFSISCFHQVLF